MTTHRINHDAMHAAIDAALATLAASATTTGQPIGHRVESKECPVTGGPADTGLARPTLPPLNLGTADRWYQVAEDLVVLHGADVAKARLGPLIFELDGFARVIVVRLLVALAVERAAHAAAVEAWGTQIEDQDDAPDAETEATLREQVAALTAVVERCREQLQRQGDALARLQRQGDALNADAPESSAAFPNCVCDACLISPKHHG
jgi:hypothetical protein